MGHGGGKTVDAPKKARRWVEQASGDGRVEKRWPDRDEGPAALLEGRALPDKPAASQRYGPFLDHPGHGKPGGDQRGLRARLQKRDKVASVVAVVVAEEDPTDVIEVDQGGQGG